tara:strand:- start:1165 stop:2394 length:1230 start_codon:yes stop_codon:yes gene_type:complete
MFRYLFVVLSLFLLTCEENENQGSENTSFVIVSLQDSDKVAIVGANNLEVEEQISISMSDHDHGHDHEAGMSQPHDIVVDNTNGYWFTTAMMGTKVEMYSVNDNELLATYNTSAMPALLSVNEVDRKLYVSGGNPSMGETNKILELEYNENSLELVEEWDVQFSYAHGMHFDEFSGYVFAVSKTVDFISRFNPNEVQIPFVNPMIVSMDSTINDNFSIEPRRLWPIEITGKYPYLFVTCSAGDWSAGSEDEEGSVYEEIPGQVQMWHMEDMNLLATYEFDTYSRPWHIEVSPIEDKFYVALSGGDGENGSSNSGVACIEYSSTDNGYSMNESWVTTSSEYGTLHGITVHSDCCDGKYYVYSTGRTDGNIYKFDTQTGQELGYSNLVLSGSVRTGGIDSFVPPCDASCCE